VTPTEFRAALTALEMTQGGFGRLTGTTDRTVRRWAAGDQDVPVWAVLLLDLLVVPEARGRVLERMQRRPAHGTRAVHPSPLEGQHQADNGAEAIGGRFI
jgi:hypothetical protein